MDNKLIILFFASVFLSGVQSAVKITKKNDALTVKVGEQYELLCTADAEPKACTFITPTGQTYVMWAGAAYENQRITQHGSLAKKQCGITVQAAKESDNGVWKCNIAAQSQGGSITADAKMTITVAVPPTNVQLKIKETLGPAEYSVRMKENNEDEEVSVDCIAEQARPKPEFIWYLGGAPLSGETSIKKENQAKEKADYIETLRYYPKQNHDGKKLKCEVTHTAYTEADKETNKNEAEVLLKVLYKPVPVQKVHEFYSLNVGQPNTIRMRFSANPKPTDGFWTINKSKLVIGTESVDKKYKSGVIEKKDAISGEWGVELTINKLLENETKMEQTLTIINDAGTTEYKFKLGLGKQPPPVTESNTLTVGIIVVIVIIVLILVTVIVARTKGILCFAGKKKDEDDTEQAMDKEGSDTESAEHHSTKSDSKNKDDVASNGDDAKDQENTDDHALDDTKNTKDGPKTSVAAKMTNFFAAMKKSVNSKSNKEKYEQTESEMKLNDGEEKKDLENGEKDDITYADLDENALSPGNRKSSLTVENEKTEYAEIKPSH